MKKYLTALTLTTLFANFSLTGCTNNNTKPHTQAPVVTLGKAVDLPAPSIAKKPNLVPIPQSKPETKIELLPDSPQTTEVTPELAPAITELIPVSSVATQAEQQRVKQQQQALRKVVILLPDHPSLGSVNRDIEKGIRMAHQQHPHNTNLQLIFIHDPLPSDQLLLKAKGFSPDWIIGPLTKSDIQTINTQLDKNQILLNRLDTSTPAYQLGLPIEDETNQILSSLGKNTQPIAVVASNDPAEQRILTSLQQQASIYKIPVLVINVDKQNATINNWLEKEGGMEQSRQRIEQLGKLLRTKFETPSHPRSDLQALILLGNAKQAHNIMPAVQYHQINWSILATSHLLPSHKGDKFGEPDFEGIKVLTPPYLISNTGLGTLFEALGWDSYQLLGNPSAINANSMTGKLILNNNNQLVRQLTWQRVHQNELKPLK